MAGTAHVVDEMRLIAGAKAMLNLVSVVPEGVTAGKVGTHGMHDITEGGVLGAIWEMCQISRTGAEVWEEAVPIRPETEKICGLFDVDPLRLISSGSMIIIVPKDKRAEMEDAMKKAHGVMNVSKGRRKSNGCNELSHTGIYEV